MIQKLATSIVCLSYSSVNLDFNCIWKNRHVSVSCSNKVSPAESLRNVLRSVCATSSSRLGSQHYLITKHIPLYVLLSIQFSLFLST